MSNFVQKTTVVSVFAALAILPIFVGCPPMGRVLPSADFSLSPVSGEAPLLVSFTDESASGSAVIASWHWSFGDGETSTEEDPKHIYATPGTYTVALTVSTSVGSDTRTQESCVCVDSSQDAGELTAMFSAAPASGEVPLIVSFGDESYATGAGKKTEEASITQWLWNFGDGTTSQERHPYHIYREPGVYTISLTVRDTLNDYVDTLEAEDFVTATSGVDTDNDGLSDGLETRIGTDPDRWDTDNDGFSDAKEYYSNRLDPLSPDAVLTSKASVLNNEQDVAISSYDPATGTLVFVYSGSKKDMPVFDAGDILIFTPDRHTEVKGWLEDAGGLAADVAGEVVSVYTENVVDGVEYTVGLAPAELLDLFTSIDQEWTYEVVLRPDGMPLEDYPLYTWSSADGDEKELTASVTVDHLDFVIVGTVTMHLVIDQANLVSLTGEVDGDMTLWMDVSAALNASFTQTYEADLGSVMIPLGPVPATAELQLGAALDLSFEGAAGVTTGFDQQGRVRFGFEYTPDAKALVPIQDFEAGGDLHEPQFDLDARAEARLTLVPKVGLSLYGTVGAYVGVRPYLSAWAETNLAEWEQCLVRAGVDVGMDAFASIEANLFIAEFGAEATFPEPPLSENLWTDCLVEPENNEEPTAAFTGDPLDINEGGTVSFTDESTAGSSAITSWSWSFGDGGASSQQNPTHTYDDAGVYTVSLTVTTAAGSDTETKSGYITVTEEQVGPTAAFSGDPLDINEGDTVSFTDESTAGSSAITTWSWSFGDGGVSSQQNPTHTYDDAGIYTVSLTVTTAAGSDTETKSGYITVGGGGSGIDHIEVLPESWTFTGTQQVRQFRARAFYTDGSQVDPYNSVTWTTGASSVATVNSSGLVTSAGAGTTYVRARSTEDTSAYDDAAITVEGDEPEIDYIEVLPESWTFSDAGQVRQFRARAFYTDGSQVDPYNSVTWTTGASSVATVNSSGLVTSAGAGTTYVRARSTEDTSVYDDAAITVEGDEPEIDYIEVLPESWTFSDAGQVRQFRARAFYTDGSQVDPYNSVTWTTGASSVATVNSSGLVTSADAGTTYVRARSTEDTSVYDDAAIAIMGPSLQR